MAIPDPKYDLLPNLRGGSDTWDQSPASEILLSDYFATIPAPVLKRHNGSMWVVATLKHGIGWPVVSFGNI